MLKKLLTAAVAAVVILAGAGSVEAADTPQIRKLLKKADQHMADNQFDKAIATLDEVLAIDPGNAEAWSRGAWIFNDQGKYDIAIKAADKALATDPDHSNALREKGYAMYKLRKHEAAAKLLLAAIESNPKNFPAYDYLAALLNDIDEPDLAKEVLKEKEKQMGKGGVRVRD